MARTTAAVSYTHLDVYKRQDKESLMKSYQAMYDAYSKIFTRLGLEFRAVNADTGNIGGFASHAVSYTHLDVYKRQVFLDGTKISHVKLDPIAVGVGVGYKF